MNYVTYPILMKIKKQILLIHQKQYPINRIFLHASNSYLKIDPIFFNSKAQIYFLLKVENRVNCITLTIFEFYLFQTDHSFEPPYSIAIDTVYDINLELWINLYLNFHIDCLLMQDMPCQIETVMWFSSNQFSITGILKRWYWYNKASIMIVISIYI